MKYTIAAIVVGLVAGSVVAAPMDASAAGRKGKKAKATSPPKARTVFSRDQVKIIVSPSKADRTKVGLETLSVPKITTTRIVKKSLTGAVLIQPLLDVFRKLVFDTTVSMTLLNKDEFSRGKSLKEQPSRFKLQVVITRRFNLGAAITSVELAIAKRAVEAVRAYKPKGDEVKARVCLSIRGLFKDLPAEQLVVNLPVQELAQLNIGDIGDLRHAAITLDTKNAGSTTVHRFSITPGMRVRWNARLRALYQRGRQSTPQDPCVLTLSLTQGIQELKFKTSFKVPQGAIVNDLRALNMRVAPAGKFLFGQATKVNR